MNKSLCGIGTLGFSGHTRDGSWIEGEIADSMLYIYLWAGNSLLWDETEIFKHDWEQDKPIAQGIGHSYGEPGSGLLFCLLWSRAWRMGLWHPQWASGRGTLSCLSFGFGDIPLLVPWCGPFQWLEVWMNSRQLENRDQVQISLLPVYPDPSHMRTCEPALGRKYLSAAVWETADRGKRIRGGLGCNNP